MMIWDDNDDAWRYRIGCGARVFPTVFNPMYPNVNFILEYDVEGMKNFFDKITDMDKDKDDKEEPLG
jgi:hypothetical protein